NSEALMLLIEAGNEEADYRDVNGKSFIKADLRWKQATNSSHAYDWRLAYSLCVFSFSYWDVGTILNVAMIIVLGLDYVSVSKKMVEQSSVSVSTATAPTPTASEPGQDNATRYGFMRPSFSYLNTSNMPPGSSPKSSSSPVMQLESPVSLASLQPMASGLSVTPAPSFSYNVMRSGAGFSTAQMLSTSTANEQGHSSLGRSASPSPSMQLPALSMLPPVPSLTSHPGSYLPGTSVQNVRADGTQEMGAIASAPAFPQSASQPAHTNSIPSTTHFASNSFGNANMWMPPAPTFQVPAGMPRTPSTPGPPGIASYIPSTPGPWLHPQQISGFARTPFSPYAAIVPGPYSMPARGMPPLSVSMPDIQPPGVSPAISSVGAPSPSFISGGQLTVSSGQADLPPGVDNGENVSNAETKDEEKLDAWTAHRTDSGTVYYYNALTGESTYEKPSGFKGESDKSTVQTSPVSWEKLAGTDWTLVTTNDGKKYYYNSKTQLSSWQIPSEVTELRRKQETDNLRAQSISVANTNIVAEKVSAPVSLNLSTPAADTGGRDATALRLSSASGSSSALDLIKKKLQDSGIPDSASPSPPLSGAVASELNGSKPIEAPIKGSENESSKDKRKDANGDGDMSDSSSDSEDEDRGPTKEKCILQFKEMLKDRGVAPFSKWEKELPKILFDPRFKAVPSHSARRALFDHYVRTRAEEERKEKRAAQKAALDGFKQLLEEAKEDIDCNTDYQAFKNKWGDDPRFQALDRKEREFLLNERVFPLKRAAQEKAQAERAASVSSFKSMLQDKGDITSASRWSKVKDNLKSDPRYKSVKHEDREKIFNEYVAELKAAEEDIERKEKARQDEEERLRERERALRKRKEREEQEVERVRLKARRKEAVESYQALLVETIKDPQASWTESKPKLEKDPQGRAANSQLDNSDLEKFFREHVKSLHERCVLEFRALLTEVVTAEAAAQETENGKTIINSWSTAKQVLKSDPRYNKMPRKERESLWHRHAEEIRRKQQKLGRDQEAEKHAEGKSRSSVDSGKHISASRRTHDHRR
ncbi:hypothetical protein RD792_009695, partial [Penstemon davidsonii]